MKTEPNPPKTLWLQWNGDSAESETGPVAESDVTWCRDRIFGRDIEYVRAGADNAGKLIAALEAELKQARAGLALLQGQKQSPG